MASVTYKNVTKKFGDVIAVNNLDIHIEDKEFLVLVGPSGCGKTTALRLLAGLEDITDGTIQIGDKVVNDIAPKDRDIAMVFQSYALYPHMSVYDNMAFGLKLQKMPKEEIDRRVNNAADILGIGELLDRKPRQLSGGQRQRVAVGRAIVREPTVFLLDEPLSNLDAKLRVQTRSEISKLHRQLETTFIYVTHDQVEAMTMATRIAVLKDGLLQQLATPHILYDKPINKFVAGFIGSPAMNFFEATLKKSGSNIIIDAGSFSVEIPDEAKDTVKDHLDKPVIFGIRPEDCHDSYFIPKEVIPAKIPGTIIDTELMGSEIHIFLENGPHKFIARIDPRSTVKHGDQIDIILNMANFHIFDKETETAII